MKEKRYVLLDIEALPDVFLRVLTAKELLAGGEAKNISVAARKAGVSRSAFYKYKDSVFRAESNDGIVTIYITLLDETGALQAVLAELSRVGGSVITINQSAPENGVANAAVTLRTSDMRMEIDKFCEELQKQRTVVAVKRRQR